MGVDTKANLLGDVQFEKILAFFRRKIDGSACLKPSSDDDYARCAWIDFTDRSGSRRNAFLFRSKIDRSDYPPDSDGGPDDEYREIAGKDGITVVSLSSDREGRYVMLETAKRFGGWFIANDCDGKPPVRVLKENPTEEERFRESAQEWKAAERKLKAAAEEFRLATKNLDPAVINMTENVGVFRLNGKTLVSMLEGAESSINTALRKLDEAAEDRA